MRAVRCQDTMSFYVHCWVGHIITPHGCKQLAKEKVDHIAAI